jgi:hypothetical protein
MFQSLPHHHQGVHAFLVKVTELKFEYSCVAMLQHTIQCIYMIFGVMRCADGTQTAHLTTPDIMYIHCMLFCRITMHEYSHFNSVTLTRNA